jgi:hypothetical protein
MEKKTYWAGMSEIEMHCRMNIHEAAARFYIKTGNAADFFFIKTGNMKLSDFHNRASWRYHDMLHGYYPDQARNWIRDNLGILAYSGNRHYRNENR